MKLRTGQEYFDSLKDEREVWLRGERVDSVAAHPALQGCSKTIAGFYDMQHDPACRDVVTTMSANSQHRVGLCFQLLRSMDELLQRRRMIEFVTRRQGGTMGRLPDY